MKECDNSTRKIHISSIFILSKSLLNEVYITKLMPGPVLNNGDLKIVRNQLSSSMVNQVHCATRPGRD